MFLLPFTYPKKQFYVHDIFKSLDAWYYPEYFVHIGYTIYFHITAERLLCSRTEHNPLGFLWSPSDVRCYCLYNWHHLSVYASLSSSSLLLPPFTPFCCYWNQLPRNSVIFLRLVINVKWENDENLGSKVMFAKSSHTFCKPWTGNTWVLTVS